MGKRIFSVLLALVLCLLALTVGVAAEVDAFTDTDRVTFQEAVDVLNGIGVLDGFEAIEPTGSFTRAEAATMIYRFITGDRTGMPAAQGNVFADVEADLWSAGAIEYCVNQGIITGLGDGNFDPNGLITGYQMAKMLLCALGYGAEGEFVGDHWMLNVRDDAAAIGLLAGIVDDLTGPLHRSAAALMMLNGLWLEQENGTTLGDKFDLAAYDGILYANSNGLYVEDMTVQTTNEDGTKTQTQVEQTYLSDQQAEELDLAAGDELRIVTTGTDVVHMRKTADYQGIVTVTGTENALDESGVVVGQMVTLVDDQGREEKILEADLLVSNLKEGEKYALNRDTLNGEARITALPTYVGVSVSRTFTTDTGKRIQTDDGKQIWLTGDKASEIKANREYDLVIDFGGRVVEAKMTGMNVIMPGLIGAIGGVGGGAIAPSDPTVTVETDGTMYDIYYIDPNGEERPGTYDFESDVTTTKTYTIPVGWFVDVYAHDEGVVTLPEGLEHAYEDEGDWANNTFIMPSGPITIKVGSNP